MARWRLRAAHYLYIGEEWEYQETDSITGRSNRVRFPVPTLLDPKDPSRWTNRDGDIVVCHEGKGHSSDTVFQGDPTPDMEPLDEEARKISDALSSRWNHPIEGIDSQKSFGDALFEGLTRKLDSLVSKQIPISENMVSREEFDSLKEQLAQLMARNAELEEKSTRRV